MDICSFALLGVVPDGLLYTPNPDFVGVDTVVYSITDGNGGTSSAELMVTVLANSPPVAVHDVAATDDRSPILINVLANDTDADGDSLTLISASAVQGTVTIEADQRLRYTPKAGFSGTDTLSYRISDGIDGEAQGTVTVTVTAYEVITVVNKSSGGSLNAGPVLLLSLLAALRRRRVRALAVTLLAVLSGAARADWSVEAFIGQSKATLSQSQVQAQLPTGASLLQFDNSATSWAVGANYSVSRRVSLQLHYVDLGNTGVTLQGETLSPAVFHQAVADIGPLSAEGIRSGMAFRLLQRSNWHLAAQVGVFSWRSEQSSTAAGSVIRHKASHSDIYWGLNSGYRINETLTLQLSLERYKLDKNNADNLMLGLSYQF